MTRRGMIPRQVNLPGVWYPGESLFSTLKFEYLSEISTKIENILTHWSVTQTGSNEEKNGGRKSCWTVPLKRQLTTQTPCPCGQWLCRHCVRVVNNYAVIVSRFLWLRWHTFFREYLRENEKISWIYVSLFIWGSGGVFFDKSVENHVKLSDYLHGYTIGHYVVLHLSDFQTEDKQFRSRLGHFGIL